MLNVYKGYCGDYYRGYCWVRVLFINLAYYTGCLGAVGVKGDISALKWDGAYADKVCADGTYTDRACADKACLDKACLDGAYPDGACPDGAYTDGAYIDEASCGTSCGA